MLLNKSMGSFKMYSTFGFSTLRSALNGSQIELFVFYLWAKLGQTAQKSNNSMQFKCNCFMHNSTHTHTHALTYILYVLRWFSRCADMPKGCIGQCGVCVTCATSKKLLPQPQQTQQQLLNNNSNQCKAYSCPPRTNKLLNAYNKFQINRWYLSLIATSTLAERSA